MTSSSGPIGFIRNVIESEHHRQTDGTAAAIYAPLKTTMVLQILDRWRHGGRSVTRAPKDVFLRLAVVSHFRLLKAVFLFNSLH